MNEINIPIIGYMNSPFKEKFGIPRQPNLVEVSSYIEMVAPYNDKLAFEGIEQFSHLWLLWQFHDNKHQDINKFRPQVRPPRLGGNKKIGVFATRSMYRPSPIGLSVVKFVKLEKVGDCLRVYVTGSDLLHGTPIVDIKPYIHYSDAMSDAQSGYAQEQPERLQVIWSAHAQQQKESVMANQRLIKELESILSLDPRPAYQNDPERIYGMRFSDWNIKFKVEGKCVLIQQLEH